LQRLVFLIEQYGLSLVFFNVLIEQAGAPLPAYPALIITGAFAVRGDYPVAALLATAVLAALIADLAWYFAGKRYGYRVLKTLCRVSLSPDTCVRQTESIFSRWGASSLLVAKFVPGFASVATALAGVVGTRLLVFVIFDGLGAMLWAGSAILLGGIFHDAVGDIVDALDSLGKWGLVVIATLFALFILSKWWQRRRFYKELRMARISVQELSDLMERGMSPTILDVRSPTSQKRDGRIPGALFVNETGFEDTLVGVPADGEVIVYCACPNEASAARIAKLLMQRGFKRVRPLHGGIDAWIAAGLGVER
jgi:membrane protein DedA with SNARE-associated domain/rhodanese-related sulfurtransferase